MEWNMEEIFRYGMEKSCRYGIWKNRLPFHYIPCSLLDAAGIVKHVEWIQHKHTKRIIISHRTLRYFVEIVHKNYEITFLVT